jgi:hypothetical protein
MLGSGERNENLEGQEYEVPANYCPSDYLYRQGMYPRPSLPVSRLLGLVAAGETNGESYEKFINY